MIDSIFLGFAIFFEVLASTMIISTKEFTRLIPSILVLIAYALSLYFMSLSMRTIPLGITYAIWSGVGIVALALIGYFYHKQTLDVPAMIGITLIIAGVLCIYLFSKSAV